MFMDEVRSRRTEEEETPQLPTVKHHQPATMELHHTDPVHPSYAAWHKHYQV